MLKLRRTCHNGVLTNVNASAPLSVHTIRTKQSGLCEKIVQSQIYLGCHPEFSYFSPKEWQTGCYWDQPAESLWRRAVVCSGHRGNFGLSSFQNVNTVIQRRALRADASSSTLQPLAYSLVKFLHIMKSDNLSSCSRLMTRRFDMKSTRQWRRHAVHRGTCR